MNYSRHSGYCDKTYLKDEAEPQLYPKRTKEEGTAFSGNEEKMGGKMLKQILYSARELLLKYIYRIKQNQKLGPLN